MTALSHGLARLTAALRDPLSGHLLRGSFVSMAVRVGGLVLAFLSHVLLSRTLGGGAYGIYSIALGWALILVIPARLGLDSSVLRFATIYREEGRPAALRGLLGYALQVLVASSLALAGLLFTIDRIAPGVFAQLGRDMVPWMAAMIFPLAALGVLSSLIRTAKRIFASQFYEQMLRPALLIAVLLVAASAAPRLDPVTAMALTVGSTALALIGIAIHFARVFPEVRGVRPDRQERGQWFALSWPLLVMSVVQEILNQIDVILLGYLAGPLEAGHFAAAWRLASLVPFALFALTAISGPLIASAHRRDDELELARIARLNARLATGFAAGMAVLLAAAGPFALRAFGPGFEQGYPALLVLLVGGLVNAFTGSVAYLMTMTGHQREALPIFGVALIVNVAVNLLLTPRLGAVGAAIAATASVCAWNLLMLAYVRRTIGIDASAVALAPRPPRRA